MLINVFIQDLYIKQVFSRTSLPITVIFSHLRCKSCQTEFQKVLSLLVPCNSQFSRCFCKVSLECRIFKKKKKKILKAFLHAEITEQEHICGDES